MQRWKAIAAGEPDAAHRAAYGAIATLFGELTGCAAPWQSSLEGWDMRESTIVAEWKAEGEAVGERRALLLFLERFGAPVPADLVAAIEAQTDLDVLARWIRAAATAPMLEDFRAVVASGNAGTGVNGEQSPPS
jgi:hypothetical protein